MEPCVRVFWGRPLGLPPGLLGRRGRPATGGRAHVHGPAPGQPGTASPSRGKGLCVLSPSSTRCSARPHSGPPCWVSAGPACPRAPRPRGGPVGTEGLVTQQRPPHFTVRGTPSPLTSVGEIFAKASSPHSAAVPRLQGRGGQDHIARCRGGGWDVPSGVVLTHSGRRCLPGCWV